MSVGGEWDGQLLKILIIKSNLNAARDGFAALGTGNERLNFN